MEKHKISVDHAVQYATKVKTAASREELVYSTSWLT